MYILFQQLECKIFEGNVGLLVKLYTKSSHGSHYPGISLNGYPQSLVPHKTSSTGVTHDIGWSRQWYNHFQIFIYNNSNTWNYQVTFPKIMTKCGLNIFAYLSPSSFTLFCLFVVVQLIVFYKHTKQSLFKSFVAPISSLDMTLVFKICKNTPQMRVALEGLEYGMMGQFYKKVPRLISGCMFILSSL